MGFALWVEGDVACAQGTHEYRPMGVAYIARNGRFTARDFRPGEASSPDACFRGYFASLGELNAYLHSRRARVTPRRFGGKRNPVLAVL